MNGETLLIDRLQAFNKDITPPLYLANILDFLWPYRRGGGRATYSLVLIIEYYLHASDPGTRLLGKGDTRGCEMMISISQKHLISLKTDITLSSSQYFRRD